MPDSIALDILKALTAQIETAPDLTGKVFRGRTIFGQEVKPPLVSILEPAAAPDEFFVGDEQLKGLIDWRLLVQGWAVDDKANPSDPAYQLLAAVQLALSRTAALTRDGAPKYPSEYRLGRRVAAVRIGHGICRPPSEASQYAFFYLPLILQVTEDASAPFLSA